MPMPKYRRQSHGSITTHLECTKRHCLIMEYKEYSHGIWCIQNGTISYCYHNTSITMKRQEINCTLPHSLTHTLTHAHTHTHTHTCTHSHMYTLKHIHAHTCTHSHLHRHTHFLSHTHTLTHAHTLTCTHSNTHMLTHAHTHSHTHMHTHTHAHSHTHTHTHTCTHSHMHTFTHTHTHTHSLTHSLTHTQRNLPVTDRLPTRYGQVATTVPPLSRATAITKLPFTAMRVAGQLSVVSLGMVSSLETCILSL